jgi:hypothetical protein
MAAPPPRSPAGMSANLVRMRRLLAHRLQSNTSFFVSSTPFATTGVGVGRNMPEAYPP